jgi:hypothetical protein
MAPRKLYGVATKLARQQRRTTRTSGRSLATRVDVKLKQNSSLCDGCGQQVIERSIASASCRTAQGFQSQACRKMKAVARGRGMFRARRASEGRYGRWGRIRVRPRCGSLIITNQESTARRGKTPCAFPRDRSGEIVQGRVTARDRKENTNSVPNVVFDYLFY